MYMYEKGFQGSNGCKEKTPGSMCRWSTQWYIRKLNNLPAEMRVLRFPEPRDIPVLWQLKGDARRKHTVEPVVLFDGELRAGRFFVESLDDTATAFMRAGKFPTVRMSDLQTPSALEWKVRVPNSASPEMHHPGIARARRPEA